MSIKNLKRFALYYLKEQSELKQVSELVSDFITVLLGKDETKLDGWIEKAEGYRIAEIDSFIKLIKRQLFGRCKFDLLRLKILS